MIYHWFKEVVVNKNKLILLSCLVLTACSNQYASNGEKYYMHSHNGTELLVPAPLTSSNISHFYDLPAQNQKAAVSVEPPPA